MNIHLKGNNVVNGAIECAWDCNSLIHITAEKDAALTLNEGGFNADAYQQDGGTITVNRDNTNPPFKGFSTNGIAVNNSITINGGILDIRIKGNGSGAVVWTTKNNAFHFADNAVFYEGDSELYPVSNLTISGGIDRQLKKYVKIVCPGETDNTVITPTYTLTVANGSGDGSYTVGKSVTITADAAPAGKTFDKWTATGGTLANTLSASTAFTMPDANATVTATYKDLPKYMLTVDGGSGSGSYYSGQRVTIKANAPEAHKLFDKWTASVGMLENSTSSETVFVMPSGAATVAASYKDAPKYVLTVYGGTGGGEYYPGDKVTVIAADAPADKLFDKWTATDGTLADASSTMTEFTMSEGATTLTATYKDIPKYSLTVVGGTGSGEYKAGEKITVTADEAPEGMIFDKWEADGAEITADGGTATFVMPEGEVTVKAVYREKTVYTVAFVSGKNSLVYEINCDINEIVSITVDGSAVANVASEPDATESGNSTRITLSSGYVSTLPDGSHELLVTLVDGAGTTSFITPYEFVEKEEADYTVWIIVGCAVLLAGAIIVAAVIIKRKKAV